MNYGQKKEKVEKRGILEATEEEEGKGKTKAMGDAPNYFRSRVEWLFPHAYERER